MTKLPLVLSLILIAVNVFPMALFQESQAVSDGVISSDYEKNYVDQLVGYDVNGNGIHHFTTHADRLPDGSGHYATPYFYDDNGGSITIASGVGTYVYDKTSCGIKFYEPIAVPNNSTKLINSIQFTAKYADSLNGTWTDLSTNTVSCSNSNSNNGTFLNLSTTKSDSQSNFQVNYTMSADHPLEYLSTLTNNLDSSHFMIITETQDGIPSTVSVKDSFGNDLTNGTILFGDSARQIQNVVYGSGGFYSYGNSIGNLYKLEYHIHSDGTKQLISNFVSSSTLSNGQSFSIDPTYGYNSGNSYVQQANNPNTASCTGANITSYTNQTGVIGPQAYGTLPNDPGSECRNTATQYDISSIPTTLTGVTSTTLKFDVTGTFGSGANCDITKVGHKPGTGTANRVWNDVQNGTAYDSNDSICTVIATGHTVTLGSTANTDIKNARTSSQAWFAIGIGLHSLTQSGTGNGESFANIQLQVVYTIPSVPPGVPTLNSVTQVSPTSLNASWTTPSGATWYWENRTSPAGGTLLNIANLTTSFHVDSGLSQGTQYQYGIQAGNGTGHSAVSNKIARYTVNIAPTSLSFPIISPTILKVGWTNPSGNFSGFKVEKETPIGGGFSTVISNTNNSTNGYNVTGLIAGTEYNFRVSTNYATGSSDAGVSSASTAFSGYTSQNPPTGLSFSSIGNNNVRVNWINPSGNFSGFKIESSTNAITWSIVVSNTGNSINNLNVTGLNSGTTYLFRVSTVYAFGSSSSGISVPSSTGSVTTTGPLTPNNPSTTFPFNATVLSFSWTTVPRNSSVVDVFVDSGYNGTVTSWYHGTSGSATLLNKLGSSGLSTLPIFCTLLTSGTGSSPAIVSNGSNIYYTCSSNDSLHHVNVISGLNANDFSTVFSVGNTKLYPEITKKWVVLWKNDPSNSPFVWKSNPAFGNQTYGTSTPSLATYNSEKLMTSGSVCGSRYNSNNTGTCDAAVTNTNTCELTNIPTNKTTSVDSSACDIAFPPNVPRYYQGIGFSQIGNNYHNSTLEYFGKINNLSPLYRKALTLPGIVYGLNEQFTTFVLHANAHDYLFVVTPNNFYYTDISSVTSQLAKINRASQTYMTVTPTTDSNYNIPASNVQQPIQVYGPYTNNTITRWGMVTLVSGYTLKTTSTASVIRNIDPQWTNDNSVYPIISTTSAVFPIFLTVSSAPTVASLKVTNDAQVVNGLSSIWSVTILDSTHSAEYDPLPNTCQFIYVADATVSPPVYNFEGTICSTGSNSKTMAYTNTLPISFWTSKYSATHSYVAQTNTLTVTTRSSVVPFAYNILLKNSNGTIVQNYTSPNINGTIDTKTFNVTTVGKPLTLFVSVNGNPIYSAFLGSSVSFASVSSFFTTYFTYHGFNLLSLLPIIFAGMFTRNSVGIGAVAVVLLIASLNFFSLVVIPEFVITIMLFISLIGLIAYRVILY